MKLTIQTTTPALLRTVSPVKARQTGKHNVPQLHGDHDDDAQSPSALPPQPIASFSIFPGLKFNVMPPPSNRTGLGLGSPFPNLLQKRADQGRSDKRDAAAARGPAMVWFRNDLRTHDHLPLFNANKSHTSIVPVYLFDPREYKGSEASRTGPMRARFLLQAVADLRARLRTLGSELLVRVGKPEEVLPKLAKSIGATAVYAQREPSYEEARVEDATRAALEAAGASLHASESATLLHPEDLGFGKGEGVPKTFSAFRDRAQRTPPRPESDLPKRLKGLPLGRDITPGTVPSLKDLGFDEGQVARDPWGPVLQGGESEALRNLDHFLRQAAQAAQAVGPAGAIAQMFNERLSPWLATGCLSPRRLAAQARARLPAAPSSSSSSSSPPHADKDASSGGKGHGAAAWVQLELQYRDFLRFVTLKYSSHAAAAPAGKAVPQGTPALAMAASG